MKATTNWVLFLLMGIILTGCYHARIETGLTPSTQVHDIPWATGWVYGLVPPKTVEAGQECPNGIAIVETELSFLNQLVGAITFGIFTPMHIKVTCATGAGMALHHDRDDVVVSSSSSVEEITARFETAANQAVESGGQIFVRFE